MQRSQFPLFASTISRRLTMRLQRYACRMPLDASDLPHGLRRYGVGRCKNGCEIKPRNYATKTFDFRWLVRRGGSVGLSELAHATGLAPNMLHRDLVATPRS